MQPTTTTTATSTKVMNLGKALKVMRLSGVPTTLAKRRKQKTMTDFNGITVTLDQHVQAYAHGAIEMKVEVRQAIFAFLEAKRVIAKANLDHAKSKRGIRKYTKRLDRYTTLMNLLGITDTIIFL